jgi:hypothetical protein
MVSRCRGYSLFSNCFIFCPLSVCTRNTGASNDFCEWILAAVYIPYFLVDMYEGISKPMTGRNQVFRAINVADGSGFFLLAWEDDIQWGSFFFCRVQIANTSLR